MNYLYDTPILDHHNAIDTKTHRHGQHGTSNSRLGLSSPGSMSMLIGRWLQVGGTIGISLAVAATVIRLALRIRKLGWDDALAFLGLICLILTGVAGKLYYSLKDGSNLPHNSRVALYYILAIGFDLTIWFSRISILFTIIRFGRYQRHLYYAAILFLLAMLILVAQIFWVCEPQDQRTHWKSKVIPQCVLGKSVAIVQVTTDALADAVLVTVPLIIMRSLRSSHSMILRIRLSVSFAVGGLTTVVSIIHAFYLWQDNQISIIVSNAELAVSLIVCNFVVLAAAVHRLWTKIDPRPVIESHQRSTVQMMFASGPTHSQGEVTAPDTLLDQSLGKDSVGSGIKTTEIA